VTTVEPSARRTAWDPPGPARRRRRWPWVLAGLVVGSIAIGVAGATVRLPYYTIAPGAALDVNELVTVDGARQYPTDDELLLLFIRQRARVNVWRWIEASIDPDIDLIEEQEFTQGADPEAVRAASRQQMTESQMYARKVALEALGYDVTPTRGVGVGAVLESFPAAGVVQEGDVVVAVDGRRVSDSGALVAAVRRHEAGEAVELRVRRGDETLDLVVGTATGEDGGPVLGLLLLESHFDFPVDVTIDTGRIGGPSAGLAMTLSVIDALTPGNLAGDLRVAVTGTIGVDGTVGGVGGLGQKALTARAVEADLFLMPADEPPEEVARARARAGDLEIVFVRTLDDALRALEAAGGDPVERVGERDGVADAA
jgi:PDZ domain-containing protein